jgi:hypothetical protein
MRATQSTWTVFHHLVFWGSLGVYFFFISIYGLIPHVRGWDNHIYWAFCTCSLLLPRALLLLAPTRLPSKTDTLSFLLLFLRTVTLFTSSSFWLTYLALVVCSLLPDLTFKRSLLVTSLVVCAVCVVCMCARVVVRAGAGVRVRS